MSTPWFKEEGESEGAETEQGQDECSNEERGVATEVQVDFEVLVDLGGWVSRRRFVAVR